MAAECDSLVLRTTDDGRRIEERVASATIIDEKCTWRIGAESRCATWIVERDREVWINTGDVAIKDEEGYLFWICKKCDWIYRNGFRVNSESIISVAQKHPDVREATVFNKNISHRHDQIKLVVTITDNPDFSKQELMSYCQSKLPKYLVPDSIEIVDHFDRNCIGIIKKSHITFQEH